MAVEVDEPKINEHKILVIDDSIIEHKVLGSCLRGENYVCHYAKSGPEGIELVGQVQPDIIILDIMMPGMSGYDVCDVLKSDSNYSGIPIIFISASEETCDKVKALELGGVDFITKPFDKTEIKARVNTHLRIKSLENQMREHMDNLELMVEDRTKQLIAQDRMAQIGVLSAGVAHEINNPTAFIRGNIQTFSRFWEDLEPVLKTYQQHQEGESHMIPFILDEIPKIIDGIEEGTSRIHKIVNGLKSFVHGGESQKAITSVDEMVQSSLDLCHNILKNNVKVDLTINNDLYSVDVDHQKIEQVLINIITNAAHAMEKKKNARLILDCHNHCDEINIVIKDNGCGIPEEMMHKIWDPFYTTKPVGKGTGLGMSISRGIIEEHGGRIDLTSEINKGTTFIIRLPKAQTLEKEG